MIKAKWMAACAVLMMAGAASAQTLLPQNQKPDGVSAPMISRAPSIAVAVRFYVVRATIASCNEETRELVMKRAGRHDVVVHAGPNVKNLDELKVGMEVVLKQENSRLVAFSKIDPERGVPTPWGDVRRTNPGDDSSWGSGQELRTIVDVTAIDRRSRVVTLRGALESRQFRFEDSRALAALKVGQRFEAALVEGDAVSILPRKP